MFRSGYVVFVLVFAPISAWAASITSAVSATGTVNTAGFSYKITADNTPTSFTAEPLPAGLTFSSTTGTISGTPTAGGIYAVFITAKGGTKTLPTTALGVVSISINGGTGAPQFLGVTSASATPITLVGLAGTPLATGVSATGALPITFKFTTLPLGVSAGGLTTSSNLLTGTVATAGVTSGTVTATNSVGTATNPYALNIGAANGAPLITSPLTVSVAQAQLFTYTPAAMGKATIAFGVDDLSKLPPGLTAGGSKPTLTTSAPTITNPFATIMGRPSKQGVYSVPITATNSVGSDHEMLVITVGPRLPGTFGSSGASITVSDSYADKVIGNCTDGFDTNPTSAVKIGGTMNLTGSEDFSAATLEVDVGDFVFSASIAGLSSGKSLKVTSDSGDTATVKISKGKIAFAISSKQSNVIVPDNASNIIDNAAGTASVLVFDQDVPVAIVAAGTDVEGTVHMKGKGSDKSVSKCGHGDNADSVEVISAKASGANKSIPAVQ